MKKLILLTMIFFCYTQFSYAQPGKPDSAFGINGIVNANLGKGNLHSTRGIQTLRKLDGTMFVIIYEIDNGRTFVVKTYSNGSIDSTYGRDGISDFASLIPREAALQTDGKIVIIGGEFIRAAIVRYNSNGSFDTTFGNAGKQILPECVGGLCRRVNSIALQNDGKILLAGHANTNGSYGFSIERYNSNGSPDSSFSNDGVQVVDFVSYHGLNSYSDGGDIAVQSDGKIVLTGFTSTGVNNISDGIARFNDDGKLDTTFSGDGKQTIKAVDNNGNPLEFRARLVVIQNNGKIGIGGNGLARYNSNGTPDSSFSGDGIQTNLFTPRQGAYVLSIAVQTDEKIVATVSGFNGINITRYKLNGSPDSSFSGDGRQKITDNRDYNFSIEIQPDQKVLITGTEPHKFSVARYKTNGTIDKSFGENGKFEGGHQSRFTTFTNLAIQKDGKIVVCGSARNTETTFTYFMSRYNINGSPDTSFSNDGTRIIDFEGRSIAIDNTGKIVIAGIIRILNNVKVALARYNSDGSVDTTFNSGSKLITRVFPFESRWMEGLIVPFVIQKDDKIVMVSTEAVYIGRYIAFQALVVVRYNTNGSVDNTFNYDGKTDDYLLEDGYPISIGILSDGKIAVGANAFGRRQRRLNGFVLTIFNIDGSLAALNNNTPFRNFPNNAHTNIAMVSSLAVQSDDKIVLYGVLPDGINHPYTELALARYNADGSLDSSFSEDGKQLFNPASNTLFNSGVKANSGLMLLDIQEDGKLVLFYNIHNNNGIIRCNSNGNLDSTFDGDGILKNTGGSIEKNSIAISGDKLYIIGCSLYSGDTLGVLNRYLLKDEIKSPPTVTLTTPANNATYLKGGNIYLHATASDADGTISKVEFYNGSKLLYSTTDTPYYFKWPNARLGNYKLTARATDNTGLVTMSDTVYISVVPNKPPAVNIINPVDGATFFAGTTLNLQGVASDTDGRILWFKFYLDTTLLVTLNGAPYNYTFMIADTGTYVITAKAMDNWGAITTSTPVSITVVAKPPSPPTVTLTTPANNATYLKGGNIYFNATASDADGTISKVEFYNGSKLLYSTTDTPYYFKWPNARLGVYKLTARVTDNTGLVTISDTVYISVVPNKPPAVNIINPVDGATFFAGATLNLQGVASDTDGRILWFKFYLDTTLLVTLNGAPYNYGFTISDTGTYIITAKAMDNWGAITASAPITIIVLPPGAPVVSGRKSSGEIPTISKEPGLELSPNPARNILNINTTGLQQGKPSTISIISSSGVVIKTIKIAGADQTIPLDVSWLTSGVYTIKLMNANKIMYRKFVKL